MISPPLLKTGDTVAIVATGRKVMRDEIKPAIKEITSWGLNVKLGPNLFSEDHAYLAGTDSQRHADIQTSLDDDSIAAIFCARGGYGTTRILDQLNFESFKNSPKWIVGFSDVTALHLKIFKLGFESIHGTMPILFSKSEAIESVNHLRKTLFDKAFDIVAPGNTNNKEGCATARIIGGNLSLIVDSLGTETEIDTNNKILLIEEIDEYRYRIDRMLVQLKRAGKFDHLKGLAVGHFTDIKDNNLGFSESIEKMISYHTKDLNIPIGFNFPSGHENPNLSWRQGSLISLEVGKEKSILSPLPNQTKESRT